MDLIGRSLAKLYLSERGYFVSFDLLCSPDGKDGERFFRFDLAALKFSQGRVERALVGMLRGWWFPFARLTPSMIRQHLAPSLPAGLSDEAVEAFRAAYRIGPVPIDRILFFSHASREKSEEAEGILREWGIETVYLERVAAVLAETPASRDLPADPFVTQVLGLLRGANRGMKKALPKPAGEPEPAPEVLSKSTQMWLDLFGPSPASEIPFPERVEPLSESSHGSKKE